MAKVLDITIIIGGSEGKTRDGAPALKVKQVINPGGKNGIYVVHADPIEGTNFQGTNKPGAWTLFFLTKLSTESEKVLRDDANLAREALQEFLESTKGEALARYNIPFCHDRYVISVSYPGNINASKQDIAEFNPADDPVEILTKIAKEHKISLEELGRKTHVVFLKGERIRHNYIENAIEDLQEKGNQITYSMVSDGDAYPRVMGSLGISTYKGKEWTIVFGASGAIEGFGTGLVSVDRIGSKADIIGRARMVHSSKNLPGEDLTGWNEYGKEDLRDFNELGITQPTMVITEAGYPERIFVASSITGPRTNVDISSDLPLSGVRKEGDAIEVSSFVIDGNGRGFLTKATYKTKDPGLTALSMRAENNYGLLDDDARSVRDYAIRKLLEATSDSEREIWDRRLNISLGIKEEREDWLSALLEAKKDGHKTLDVVFDGSDIRKLDIDQLIDDVLSGKISLGISEDKIVTLNNNRNQTIASDTDALRSSSLRCLGTMARLEKVKVRDKKREWALKVGDVITVSGLILLARRYEELNRPGIKGGKLISYVSVKNEFNVLERIGVLKRTGKKDKDQRVLYEVLVSPSELLATLPQNIQSMLAKSKRKISDEDVVEMRKAIADMMTKELEKFADNDSGLVEKHKAELEGMPIEYREASFSSKIIRNRILRTLFNIIGIDGLIKDKNIYSNIDRTRPKNKDLSNLNAMERLNKRIVADIKSILDRKEEIYQTLRYAIGDGDIDEIMILGMGGSGIAPDVAGGLTEDLCNKLGIQDPIKVTVVKGDNIPREEIGKNTLVIALTWSGTTGETLSAFQDAINKGATHLLGVSTDGTELKKIARSDVPFIQLPNDEKIQPREGYNYTLPLNMLIRGFILDKKRDGFLEAVSNELYEGLEEIAKFMTEHPDADVLSDEILKRGIEEGKGFLFIYEDDPLLSKVALRMFQQNSECHKHPCWLEPDLRDISVESLRGNFIPVIIKSSDKKLRAERNLASLNPIVIKKQSDNYFADTVKREIITTRAIYRLAAFKGIDPIPVFVIDKFKGIIKDIVKSVGNAVSNVTGREYEDKLVGEGYDLTPKSHTHKEIVKHIGDTTPIIIGTEDTAEDAAELGKTLRREKGVMPIVFISPEYLHNAINNFVPFALGGKRFSIIILESGQEKGFAKTQDDVAKVEFLKPFNPLVVKVAGRAQRLVDAANAIGLRAGI